MVCPPEREDDHQVLFEVGVLEDVVDGLAPLHEPELLPKLRLVCVEQPEDLLRCAAREGTGLDVASAHLRRARPHSPDEEREEGPVVLGGQPFATRPQVDDAELVRLDLADLHRERGPVTEASCHQPTGAVIWKAVPGFVGCHPSANAFRTIAATADGRTGSADPPIQLLGWS